MKKILGVAVVLSAGVLAGCASRPQPAAEPPPAAGPAPAPYAQSPTPPPAGPATGAAQRSPQEAFAAEAGDRVFFDLDSTRLRPEAQAILDRQAQWLAARPNLSILIAGNCDERGTREYNIALGARRAEAVRAYLTARGVPAARLRTISYGKERPIDAGADEQAWARNRNAHTVVEG